MGGLFADTSCCHKPSSEMAPTTEPAPLSNTDAGEKPVREQLKKASIAGMQEDAKAAGLAAPEAIIRASRWGRRNDGEQAAAHEKAVTGQQRRRRRGEGTQRKENVRRTRTGCS